MRHDEILGFLNRLLAPGMTPTLTWAAYWEFAFWIFALIVAATLLLLRPQWLEKAEDGFRRISQHRGACVWAIFGAVFVIRLALLPLVPVPIPVPHDEYSYLLQSDTFASGRLTIPPHPMWVHFETFHVNMQPTYQSMYPPAQAMFMALGQKLTGAPWAGVLFSVALMCAVFCWMLQGWMPPQWALLGGVFTVVRYGIFSYWVNSYFGGAVAAIGGALLLGALPRMRRRLSLRCTVLSIIGLFLLANSRPLEGFLFSLPLLLALLCLIVRSQLPRRRLFMRIVIPGTVLLAMAAGWMLYYNWRGTGHLLTMPYMLNQASYHLSRPFLFQKPYPPGHYNHPEMRAFYIFHELPDILLSRSRWGLELIMSRKFYCYYVFMVWPFLLLFVPGVILAARSRELRVVLGSTLLMTAGATLQIWPAHGHYAAPAAGAVLLILLNALRALGMPAQPSRYRYFSRAIVFSIFLWMLVPIADRLWNPYAFDVTLGGYEDNVPQQIQGQTLQARFSQLPGQHLVLVHYRLHDIPSQDWIYNRPDIDSSKVVWARDMGFQANQELLRYYPNRQVWYVDRGSGATAMPYSSFLALTHPADALLANNPEKDRF
jgi:hypothetical protein